MSMIPGLERPAPVPNELTKPFWDALQRETAGSANLHLVREAPISAHPALRRMWIGRQFRVERGAGQRAH